MNSRLLLGALLCLLSTMVFGQNKQYSYITDRKFKSPDELQGYDFRPAMKEVPGEDPEEIPVGKYSFGVTQNNLYVEGPGIQGVYSVNNTNTTEYGFNLQTMNARDPTIQGHLKVVVDEEGHVEGLIFKRSTHEKEIIFFMRVIPPEVDEIEAEYFTNKGTQVVPAIDSLWGEINNTGIEVRPFLRIFKKMGGVQQRIIPSDSVYLHFYKVISVEEKLTRQGKKDRKEARKALRAKEDEFVDSGLPLKSDSTTIEEPIVESVVEEPQEPAIDTNAIVADTINLDSLYAINPLAKYDEHTLATGVDTARQVKLIITTKYFIDLNSIAYFEDGSSEMQHRTFQVNGVVERENENAINEGNRYQWEFNLEKQPSAYVYLDSEHRVNSIYIDGQMFYLRGE